MLSTVTSYIVFDKQCHTTWDVDFIIIYVNSDENC